MSSLSPRTPQGSTGNSDELRSLLDMAAFDSRRVPSVQRAKQQAERSRWPMVEPAGPRWRRIGGRAGGTAFGQHLLPDDVLLLTIACEYLSACG